MHELSEISSYTLFILQGQLNMHDKPHNVMQHYKFVYHADLEYAFRLEVEQKNAMKLINFVVHG